MKPSKSCRMLMAVSYEMRVSSSPDRPHVPGGGTIRSVMKPDLSFLSRTMIDSCVRVGCGIGEVLEDLKDQRMESAVELG